VRLGRQVVSGGLSLIDEGIATSLLTCFCVLSKERCCQGLGKSRDQ
jgi:hypothetical protein